MRYNKLGRSGLLVSPLCLGMMSYGSAKWAPWVLDKSEGRAFVKQALDHGINFFDTADFYSLGESEVALGEAIASLCARSDVVISTKAGLPMGAGPNARGSSRKHLVESVDASLRRLGTDYIDIFLTHSWDPNTPAEETVDTLEDLVRAGKILYYGCSNYMAWQTARAHYAAKGRGGRGMTCTQLQYNLIYREEERDMLPLCEAEGLGVMVFSPLARGWLVATDTGTLTEREKTRAQQDVKTQLIYGSDGDRAVRARLIEVAERHGVPPGRIALAWLHSRPQVSTVLVGALEPAHLDEAVASLDVVLTPDDIASLEAAYVAQGVKSDGLAQVQAQSKA